MKVQAWRELTTLLAPLPTCLMIWTSLSEICMPSNLESRASILPDMHNTTNRTERDITHEFKRTGCTMPDLEGQLILVLLAWAGLPSLPPKKALGRKSEFLRLVEDVK